MATHSSVLAWRIPGTGELGGCRLWGHTELDMTEATQQQQQQQGRVNTVKFSRLNILFLTENQEVIPLHFKRTTQKKCLLSREKKETKKLE